MTREEAINVIFQMGLGIGPLGKWNPEDMYPRIDGIQVDDYIAQAAPEDLNTFIALIAVPPDEAELLCYGNMYFVKDYPEDLFWFIGHWARRDSTAFWEKIGPLLEDLQTRQRALECCSFALGDEGLLWLMPLVANIEELQEPDRLLLIESLEAIGNKETFAVLEQIKTNVNLSLECRRKAKCAIDPTNRY